MTESTQPSLITRYQTRRTRRFLADEQRWSTWFPTWRTQSRRRILVVSLGVVFALMFAVGVLCHFGVARAPLLWFPVCLLFFPAWIMLQVVSGRQADAPASTLDEWEVEQRDSARSIGLAVTQNLGLIAVFYLLYGAVFAPDGNADWHYAGAIFTLVALMVGGCTPAMILGWTRPDAEPEDQ